MNKIRKGFLTASSIITFIGVAGAVLLSLFGFLMGGLLDEDLIKESYKAEETYTYYEDAKGEYYFTYIEDGQKMIITQDEIKFIAKISSVSCFIVATSALVFAIAKLILAIKILVSTNRDKYSKGCVIALLVLSILNFNIFESICLIVAMSVIDSVKTTNNNPLELTHTEVEQEEEKINDEIK